MIRFPVAERKQLERYLGSDKWPGEKTESDAWIEPWPGETTVPPNLYEAQKTRRLGPSRE